MILNFKVLQKSSKVWEHKNQIIKDQPKNRLLYKIQFYLEKKWKIFLIFCFYQLFHFLQLYEYIYIQLLDALKFKLNIIFYYFKHTMFNSEQDIRQWGPFDSPEHGFLSYNQDKSLISTISHEEDEEIFNFIEKSKKICRNSNQKEVLLNKQIIQGNYSSKSLQMGNSVDMENFSKYIKNKKNQMKAQKKNTNFIKFIIKLFFKEVKCQNVNCKEKDSDWLQFNQNLQAIVFERGTNNLTLSTLQMLFSSDFQELALLEKKNRRFLSKLIRSPEFLTKNIIQNPYIKDHKNRMQYFLASKVFQLRCRSRRLVRRQQTR